MDLKDVVKTVAPWIGTALGGPLGGMAVEAVASIFGLSDKTESSLKAAISGATPEQMLALKKADSEFALKVKELGFNSIRDLEKIAADDRNSAREMQKSTRSKVPATLSLVVTVGYFGILGGMLTGQFKLPDSQALLLMLGSLSTAWGMVMSFWFGTTRGSEQKTEIIAQSPPVGTK